MRSRIFFEHHHPSDATARSAATDSDQFFFEASAGTYGAGVASALGANIRVHKHTDLYREQQNDYRGTRRFINRQRLKNRHIYLQHDGDTKIRAAMAAYKSLRTNILHKVDKLQAKSLMVIGPTQNVGKTLTTINLALAVAKLRRRRVFLVDLDLRSPSIHEEMGFESYGSIVDVAAGRKRLDEVLVDPGIDRLTILPGKGRWEDSSERLTDSAMANVFQELHSIPNSLVIYDTPPILGCDDVAAVAPQMDAGLLVISQHMTKRSELRDSIEQLSGNINIVGVSVNRSTEADFSAYYYA